VRRSLARASPLREAVSILNPRAGSTTDGTRIPFTKVEGLGNDFVVVDLRPAERGGDPAGMLPAGALLVGADPDAPGRVVAICDRHFGIGADGILAILPGRDSPGRDSPGRDSDARMRVLNADGSEAEMCGNGLRCVAKVLYESDPRLRRSPLLIETGAGVLACELEVVGPEVRAVTVAMGKPRLARGEIPMLPGGDGPATREAITARDRIFHLTAVSMGNPHAVIFVDDPAADLRQLAEGYGPTIETSPTFPRRTNVEFARVRGHEIDLVVWERGCGITLACGTGACATAVAAGIEGRLGWGTEATVHLPGGALFVTVAPDGSDVRMRGPAREVFRAELDLAAFGRAASD
jgi:diaminopimelate epimerase